MTSPASPRPALQRRRAGLRAGLALAALSTLTAGCTTMPLAGPLAPAIDHQAADKAPPFMLVHVTPMTISMLEGSAPEDLKPLATPQPAAQQTIHVGDVLSITLWEFGSGLLTPMAPAMPGTQGFATAQGLVGAQSATLPNQAVDQTGLIMVPFAGDIHVAGHTPREVQAAIVKALRGKANETQALVQIVQTTDNATTVTGDVNKPGRFPLALGGTRLLDAIAQAGGTSGKAREMVVQLARGGEVRRLRLASVMADPAQNIYLKPDDLVTLDNEPQSVVVLGATNKNAEVPFGKARFTLAEALGNGGGLNDRQADPYGVYVLRYERIDAARAVRAEGLPDYWAEAEVVPIIYHFDMRSANGLLLAQNFSMRDHDLVFVATSPSIQVNKLAHLFDQVTALFKNTSVSVYDGY